MAEEARRFPITCRAKASASLGSATEIDLGGILGRNNPASDAVRVATVFKISS
jgi:hypothetical protein